MYVASLAALCAVLIAFTWIGLRARTAGGDLDDYLTARNSQGASALGLSFLASGLGAWIPHRESPGPPFSWPTSQF